VHVPVELEAKALHVEQARARRRILSTVILAGILGGIVVGTGIAVRMTGASPSEVEPVASSLTQPSVAAPASPPAQPAVPEPPSPIAKHESIPLQVAPAREAAVAPVVDVVPTVSPAAVPAPRVPARSRTKAAPSASPPNVRAAPSATGGPKAGTVSPPSDNMDELFDRLKDDLNKERAGKAPPPVQLPGSGLSKDP
jgi:hypothetical protein